MVFITLFDFHCTRLMIKFIELNNDNTLTKIQYFFYFENNIFIIFFNFFLIPIPLAFNAKSDLLLRIQFY